MVYFLNSNSEGYQGAKINHHTKIYLIIIILLLSVTSAFPQKRKTNKKRRPVRKSKKVLDSRLTPLSNRKYNHSFELTSQYDRFDDVTTVMLRIPINSMETMYFHLTFKGEQITKAPKKIIFQYFGNSDKFQFEVKHFIILTDKDRFNIKMIQLPTLDNGKIPFAASFDYPTLLRMANGKTVAMKIGQTELYFDDQSLEALKDFASRANTKIDRTKEIAEKKAIEKEVRTETNKLIKLTPRVKAQIRKTLDNINMFKQGVSKVSSENSTDKDVMFLLLKLSLTINEELKSIPQGLFRELLSSSFEDINSSLLIYGTKVKIFDENNPSYKPIFDRATEKYKLGDYPDNEQHLIPLSNSEESFYLAFTIALAAKIIEFE